MVPLSTLNGLMNMDQYTVHGTIWDGHTIVFIYLISMHVINWPIDIPHDYIILIIIIESCETWCIKYIDEGFKNKDLFLIQLKHRHLNLKNFNRKQIK